MHDDSKLLDLGILDEIVLVFPKSLIVIDNLVSGCINKADYSYFI